MPLSAIGLQRAFERLTDALYHGDAAVSVCKVTKAELKAAVAAADAWADANAASFNAALPLPFRAVATPAEKAALLAYVALTRYGV